MTDIIELDGTTYPAASGTTKQLVIMLHGVGADGNDLISLAPMMARQLPNATFIAPNAPFPCDMAPMGYQWFSLQNRDEAALEEGVKTVAPILNNYIDTQMKLHAVSAAQTAILGFSQGTMTALYTILRRKTGMAAIVGFSGAMVAAAKLPREIKSVTPVCLIHGDADLVVPYAAMAIAQRSLIAAKVPVETHTCHNLGHGIDQQGIEIATNFMQKHLE